MFDWCKKYSDQVYVLARFVVGIMLFMHGLQKWGYLGGPGIAGFSGMVWGQMWLAYVVAIIETVGGLFIALGLFTRAAAFFASIVMIVALATVHFPKGWNPLAQGGEMPLLYLMAFLMFKVYGNGKWSLEQTLMKKETF